MEKVNFNDIVENEWREQYDREWGLGLVTSVDQGDGNVWVTKIGQDATGYFLTNEAAIRNKSKLRSTGLVVDELALSVLGGKDTNPNEQ